ncbi:hypothetical protein L3081_25095 [Colwellia sp. MSW7]|uniref:Uncharacterized protein n=1 Tax=Colwellia maritima TaxID=2912588 RepID=A0ABS9X7A0_9GAMM|nr:hypothetical protein [Colwellia maritima]MCI2286102.1 hypothetical protein [Colwellia maritima]
MTTQDNNDISEVKPEFSFNTSIKTCLLPTLIVTTCLFFLVQLYILIDLNQAIIGEFLRVEYINLNYLFSAIYLPMMTAIYVTCCNIKYNNAFTETALTTMYGCLAILYIGLMLIMFHSFETLELFTQIQDILHTFTFAPLWLLMAAFLCFMAVASHNS